MNVLDLFSGIGGFSLGLERAGMRTVAFCEIDPYCQAVLRKHWPDVPIFGDVRTLTGEALADATGFRCGSRQNIERERKESFQERRIWGKSGGCGVDVICGGFPCQDISVAGKGAGLAGERSGLWSEYARIIGEVRPQYIIVENVAALLGRGLSRVLGDLATLGYDAEWHCIPASAVGAPHRRDRVWIIGYPNHESQPVKSVNAEMAKLCRLGNSDSAGLAICKADKNRQSINGSAAAERASGCVPDANSESTQRFAITWRECSHWLSEPDVGRVAHGVPSRVDRLKALGNAVVPQIPEIIGRVIMGAG